jgi:hypothetical protein
MNLTKNELIFIKAIRHWAKLPNETMTFKQGRKIIGLFGGDTQLKVDFIDYMKRNGDIQQNNSTDIYDTPVKFSERMSCQW